MNKIFLTIIAISLLAASCTVGGNSAKVGIVKTANGGIDWQSANKIANTDKTLLQRSISQMKFNSNKEKIFASSFSGGLYSSDDAGENWTEVLGNIPIFDFVFHPFDDNIIYASSYLSERGRLLVTKDAGKSWNEIYSDVDTKNPVRAVAINPNNPLEVLIGLGKGALIRSEDAGNSWRLVQNYNERINRIIWNNNDLYVVVRSTGVFKSTDNGISFSQITKNLRTPKDSNKLFTFTGSIGDYRQLAVNPSDPNNLMVTTDKGLYESSDGGGSWNYVNLPIREQDRAPFAVAFADSSDEVIYTSVGSVVLKSIDGGFNWSSSDTKTNGLVTTILVSPELPQLAFAGVSQ